MSLCPSSDTLSLLNYCCYCIVLFSMAKSNMILSWIMYTEISVREKVSGIGPLVPLPHLLSQK